MSEIPKKPKRSRFGPPKEEVNKAGLEQLAKTIMANTPALPASVRNDDWQPGMDDGSTRAVAPVSMEGGSHDGPVTKVFVASLSYGVREEHLRGLFQNYSSVVNVNVIMDRDDPMKSRGFGFVEFSNKDEAAKAVNEMNGAMLMGRNIVAKISEDKKQAQKSLPDWDCMECGAKGCFGSKPNCFRCGASNPGMSGGSGGNSGGRGGYGDSRGGGYGDRQGGRGGNGGRPADWDCTGCGATGCFGSKPTCFRCGAPNPNNSGGGYGGRDGGDRRGGGRDRDRGHGGGYNERRGGGHGGGYNDRQQSGGYGGDRDGGYGGRGGRDRERDYKAY